MAETEQESETVVDDGAQADLSGWNEWDVEASPVGPQGVILPRESFAAPDAKGGAGASLESLADGEEEFGSPEERAQARFERLSTAFATTLVLVGKMYRDEDWRYLRKADGSAYSSLVEVCQVAMGKSVSMARRYVQGARDFYLPLSAVMVEGTRLEITSGDIASLGTDGVREAVESASGRLDGVQDPDDASEIINDSVREAKESRRSSSAGSEEPWGDGDSRDFDEQPPSDASGPVLTHMEDEDEGPVLRTEGADGVGALGSGHFSGAEEDLISPLLAGAPLFYEEEALADLPGPVKRVVRAMVVLENANVAEIASALNYENRGVVVHGDAAQKAIARIRSMAETQPWVMTHLGHTS